MDISRSRMKVASIDPFWDNISTEDWEHWLPSDGKTDYGDGAWERTFGTIPKGFFVVRECEEKLCVSPYHIYLGVAKDLVASLDMEFTSHKGNEEYLRYLSSRGVKQKDLASIFHCSISTIRSVINADKRRSVKTT